MRLTQLSSLISLLALGACSSTGGGPTTTPPVQAATDNGAALELVDRSGDAHDLPERFAKGQPTALIFWQTWCGSCLKEAPQLAEDAKQWGDQILFLGVIPGPEGSVDEEAVDKVVAQFKLPYAQVRDKDLALTKRYEISGTPTILVLGKDGQVLYNGHRSPGDWSAFVK